MRYGVIGTGHWARTVHAAGIAASAEDELVGVWGRTPDHRDSLAADLGVTAFSSVEAMLEEVEAVAMAGRGAGGHPTSSCALSVIRLAWSKFACQFLIFPGAGGRAFEFSHPEGA